MHFIQIKQALFYLFSLDLGFNYLVYEFRDIAPFKHRSEVANRLVCITWLSWTVGLCYRTLLVEPWNLVKSPWTLFMQDQLISYFIYDLVILCSTERGRKQTVFFIHHFISLMMCFINPIGDNFSNNSFIGLLELASPLLNINAIMKEYAPHHWLTRYLYSFTRVLYFFTRILCFAPWIMYYIHYHYQWKLNDTIMLGSMFTIFLASVKWFKMMK